MKNKNSFINFLNSNIKAIFISTVIIVLALSIIRGFQLQETQNPIIIMVTPIAFMFFFSMAGTLCSMIGGIIGLIVIYFC